MGRRSPPALPVIELSATAGVGVAGVIGHLQAFRDELAAQRSQVDVQLVAVEGALAAISTSPHPVTARSAGRARGGGARRGSLREYIERVLRGRSRPISVKGVTAAVLKAGYRSKNKTLDKSVGVALAEMRQVVKVARGQYRLRG
jgi:hypothetical protein